MSQVRRVINVLRKQASHWSLLRKRYEQKRDIWRLRYRDQLLALNRADQELLSQLHRDGIAITSLDALGLSLTSQMWESAHLLVEDLKQLPPPPPGQFLLKADLSAMLQHPAIFAWGLQERLLDVLEHYLSLPVAYHGAYLRRDLANSVMKKSRLWHTDFEDDNTLKILVYLHDMDSTRGPFEYLPKEVSDRVHHSLGHRCGYMNPGTLEQLIQSHNQLHNQPQQWEACLGAAGTVAIIDTGRLIHRGQRPECCDRYTLFFDYTSQMPRRPYYCKSSIPLADLIPLSEEWSDRQRQAVFWRSNQWN